MAATDRSISFRLTLLALVVGLLLCAVASIAIVGAVTSARSIRELESKYFDATATAVGSEVRAFFEPAVSVLFDTRGLARQARFSLADGDDLGRYFAVRLRQVPTVAWLSYSEDASGRFTGVWRRENGALVLNRSDPAVDGGMPAEHELAPDGSFRPFHRELKGGYDPRVADWYRRAASGQGVVWTEPFLFNEGRPGITSALGLRRADDAPIEGVLTADFFLDDLSRYLRALARDADTSIHVLSRRGSRIASSDPPGTTDSRLLHLALASAPQGVGAVEHGRPVSWTLDVGGTAYVAALSVARVGGSEWVTATLVPEDRFLAGVHGNRRVALLLGGAAILLSLALGWLLAHRVAQPLVTVATDLGRVAEFELLPGTAPRSRIREIATLVDAAERMKASLRSFGKYVPTELVKSLLSQGAEARLGGTHRTLTLFFSDIEGFTSISERMDPPALVEQLRGYFEAMNEILRAHGGTIDKYIGDAIMALFNAPQELEAHPAAACRAALESQVRLRALKEAWEREGTPVFAARIGLHTGDVLVGNIGTQERFAYTAIGDAVNLASRLEALNKRYGTRILASAAVRAATGAEFAWRTVDRVTVAGREGATDVCELLGRAGDLSDAAESARRAYEAAFATYLARDFAAARAGFRAAAEARPGDLAAELLASRCEGFLRAPPPEDWGGAEVLTSK